jgi:hypothetical protein
MRRTLTRTRVAVYIALFAPVKLAPGERGAVLVLANGIDQAGLVFSYAKAFRPCSPASLMK